MTTSPSIKSQYFQVRVRDEDLLALKRQAEMEQISVSDVIRRAIVLYLRDPASFFAVTGQDVSQSLTL